MNDIDGDTIDDYDDEESNVSDLDSILAMAKRLDDASIISDPSIIEGTTPHVGIGLKQNYGGIGRGGGGRGGGSQYRAGPSSGRGGGLYSDRRRDLDSIVSESDDSSSSSSESSTNSSSSGDSNSRSSSEASVELNPNRGKQGVSSRPMGQPRVGHHDEDGDINGHQFYHHPQQQRHQHHNHNHQRRYRQPESPSESYESEEDVEERLPSDRFSEQTRGNNSQRRGGGPPSQRTRSRSPNRPSTTYSSTTTPPRGRMYDNDKKWYEEKDDGNEEEMKQVQKRKKLKLAMIASVIILVVVAIIAIVVTVKNGNKEEEQEEQLSIKFDNTDEYQLSLPTSSPSYSGLYDCPFGKEGAVPIRGCAGFVVCDTLGEKIGNIKYCDQGTLYDVNTNVCNHVDDVVCSTPSLPPAMASSLTPELIPPTPAPASTPTVIAITDDSAPSSVTTVTFKPTNPGDMLGPIVSYDQRLDFVSVSSPGDVTILQISLQNYLNNFYSSSNLDTLEEDDVLRSLSDVSISLTVRDFETRKRRSILVEEVLGDDINGEDARRKGKRRSHSAAKPPKMRGNRKERRHLQTTNDHFIVIYDQTTTYRTIDTSISIDTILSRPFDAEYTALLIEQLQQRDQDTFSSLTGIEFVGTSDEDNIFDTATNAPTVTLPRTKRPSPAPTATKLSSSPSQGEALPPPTAQPSANIPAAIMINGITFLDKDEDGLYETNTDSILEEVYVNLKACDGDGGKWKATTTTDANGQFSFAIEEGEYFLEFFKPSPSEQYDFTIPRVGADDIDVLDSDVVDKDAIQGQSNCMTVKEGFNQLTNAGYIISSSGVASTTSSSPPSTTSQYCAFVTSTGSGSGQQFDFEGCRLPCSNPDRACPDGMLCAYTRDC
jgi:hypothetical protein